MSKFIQVRAKATGFYGSRRRPGAEFSYPADKKLAKWMEKVLPEAAPPSPDAGKKAAVQASTTMKLDPHDDASVKGRTPDKHDLA